MSMKNCSECSKEVSIKTAPYPHCGHLFKMEKPLWLKIIMVIAVLGVVGTILSGEAKAQTKLQQRVNKAVAVTAVQLDSDYDANEVSANQKYKNKDLVVTGWIEEISETFGSVSVTLAGDGDFSLGVLVRLEKSEVSKAANLSKGQQVKILGVGGGSFLGVTVNKGIILE